VDRNGPATISVASYVPATIVTAMACSGFILLLTPTGNLPSARWRWWVGITAGTPVVLLLVVTLSGAPGGRRAQPLSSPLDLRALDGGLLVAYLAAFAVVISAVVVAAASLVGRFRRARGIERQQLRWVALATVLIALFAAVDLAALALGVYWLAPVVGGLNPPILSAAIGAAILRYRLYDLDRIISRTLAYALLTLLLGGGYAAVVLGLGRLLPEGSSLVVAAATLAVAALFQPARRRIQQAVDRRFNRRRHDAAQMIEAFGTRLRDQVDLDPLTAELLAKDQRQLGHRQVPRSRAWDRKVHGRGDRRRAAPAGEGCCRVRTVSWRGTARCWTSGGTAVRGEGAPAGRFALQRAIDDDFAAAGSPRRQRFCDGDDADGSGGPPWPVLAGGPPCPPLSEGAGCLGSSGCLAFCFLGWGVSQ
jgi:hypothetical protein